MTELACELMSITVEHLRGFERATLDLRRQNVVLVGPNNGGKTSLLRILHWVFEGADEDLLLGRRKLTDAERQLLLPARDSRRTARRITLSIRIRDGRRARSFNAADGQASLRLQFRASSVFASLKRPRRGEPSTSSSKAITLLKSLRRCLSVVLIDSSRDASSTAFEQALEVSVRRRLEQRLLHQERGGAPAEYRAARKALAEIEDLADKQAESLWKALGATVPGGLAREGRIDFDVSPATLVEWLTQRARLRVSTGLHDARMVPPSELGSGLQSVLLMRLLEGNSSKPGSTLLLLEEPEAFLHPSAQRSLARSLFDSEDVRLVVSTHSTVVVDESVAADVMIVRDHRLYAPKDTDGRRRQINSALLTGQGSEAIFSRSVLLVEGPGDRAFFERLRRRLAQLLPAGPLGMLGTVSVGGKARFGPWIQLLESYVDRRSGVRPVEFVVVADSVDATADLARGLREGGLSIPVQLDRHLKAAGQAFREQRIGDGISESRAFNELGEASEMPAVLMPVDLEYAVLAEAKPDTIQGLCATFEMTLDDGRELMKHLGSKIDGSAINAPKKHDWMRAEIAAALPWEELSQDIRFILRRWLAPVLPQFDLSLPRQLRA